MKAIEDKLKTDTNFSFWFTARKIELTMQSDQDQIIQLKKRVKELEVGLKNEQEGRRKDRIHDAEERKLQSSLRLLRLFQKTEIRDLNEKGTLQIDCTGRCSLKWYHFSSVFKRDDRMLKSKSSKRIGLNWKKIIQRCLSKFRKKIKVKRSFGFLKFANFFKSWRKVENWAKN